MFPSLGTAHRVKLDEQAWLCQILGYQGRRQCVCCVSDWNNCPTIIPQLQLTEKTQHFLKTLTQISLQGTIFRLPWISVQGDLCVEPEPAETKSYSPKLQLHV